jgi:hypothetical protein
MNPVHDVPGRVLHGHRFRHRYSAAMSVNTRHQENEQQRSMPTRLRGHRRIVGRTPGSSWMHPCRWRQSHSWMLFTAPALTCVCRMYKQRSACEPSSQHSTASTPSAPGRASLGWREDGQVVGCALPSISVSGVPWCRIQSPKPAGLRS